MTSFILNSSFTYVLRIIILDVTKRQRERKREGIPTASRMYHQTGKEPLVVARLLFLTSNLLLPSTVCVYFHDISMN